MDDHVLRDFEGRPGAGDDGTDALTRARWPRTDHGAARRLIAVHGADMRYVNRRGWAIWDGRRFDLERGDVLARQRAHTLLDLFSAEAEAVLLSQPSEAQIAALRRELDEDAAGLSESAILKAARKRLRDTATAIRKVGQVYNNSGKMKSALEEAQFLPGAWVDTDDVDARLHVFNAANGRIDLLKLPPADLEGFVEEDLLAAFAPHDRADLATRISPVSFDPSATCPRFLDFMAMIQPDRLTRRYLQKIFGYCLSGSTAEQAAFMFRGEGANGKSTLMATVSHIMGDYASPCPIETFLRDGNRSGAAASPDIARLPGVRLIQASEPETGAVLSEGRIKAFSGGEEISARELHGRMFDFRPTGKIFLSFNRTPQIKADDDGTWRRLKIIPFPVRIPPERRRPLEVILAEFREEASGILNWLVEGWRLYAAEGLADPPEVEEASREMRESFDLLGQFLADCCAKGDAEEVLFKDLRIVADLWFEEMGLQKPSANRLGRMLGERGFRKAISGRNSDRAYRGLRLLRRSEPRHEKLAKWLQDAGIVDDA